MDTFTKFKLTIGISFGALLLIALLQNTEVVSLKFLFWELSMSRIILLPIVMFFGVIVGFILGRKSMDER